MLDEKTKRRVNRLLTWVLAILLMISLVSVVYIANNPPATDPFTEFYILGPDGEAADYPTELSPGDKGTVIVGIRNQEHETITYQLVIAWNGSVTQTRRVAVDDAATAELRISITAPSQSRRYRVNFLLYKPAMNTTAPYRTLRLWIEVT